MTCTKDGQTYDIHINYMPKNGKCVIILFTALSVVHQDWGIVFMDEDPAHQDEVYAITDRRVFKEWVADNLGNAKFIWNSTPDEIRRWAQNSASDAPKRYVKPGLDYVTIKVSELAKHHFCEVITK